MPKFAIAPDAEQAKISATVSESADLAPYQEAVTMLNQPANRVQDGRYSKWLRIDLAAGETRKSESRRFSTAAKNIGLHLQSAHDEKNDRVFWLRVRPAPKARAKKNGASA